MLKINKRKNMLKINKWKNMLKINKCKNMLKLVRAWFQKYDVDNSIRFRASDVTEEMKSAGFIFHCCE